MAKIYDRIDDRLKRFIEAQPMFFVATAPDSGGHVNLSPKGYRDTFAVVDDHTFAYLDLFGSGVETVAHLRQNGRITVMFCSFDRNSSILRLFGTGRVTLPGTPEFDALRPHFGLQHPGIRSAVVVDVTRVADSCGYAVPYLTEVGERPVLDEVQGRRTAEDWAHRVANVNAHSIDGLPGLEPDHPLPTSIAR